MHKLLRVLLLVGAMLIAAGCNVGEEVEALQSFKDARKVWIFVQLNIANEGGDMESYYYYGRLSQKLYGQIRENKIARGFLLLEEVRYYSADDDKIHPYEDDESSGELVFRIEDIKRIQLLAKPPQMEKPLGEEPIELADEGLADGAVSAKKETPKKAPAAKKATE